MGKKKTGKQPQEGRKSTAELEEQTIKKRIEKQAFHKYITRGKVPGHELSDWLEAEREVKKDLQCQTC